MPRLAPIDIIGKPITMKEAQKTPAFPYPSPWENFAPTVCTLSSLREDPRYLLRLEAAHGGKLINEELRCTSVVRIATTLGLGKPRRDRLALDFALILSWYLGPQIQELLDIEVDACRRELAGAATTAGALRSALGQIDTMVGASFRDVYNTAAGDPAPAQNLFEFDQIAAALQKIEGASLTLIEALGHPTAGRPSNFVRNTAIRLMCQALEEAGAKKITSSRGKGDRPGTHLHFTNDSGRAVLALFKLCDHRLDESLIVRSFEIVRPKRRRSNLAENSAQKR